MTIGWFISRNIWKHLSQNSTVMKLETCFSILFSGMYLTFRNSVLTFCSKTKETSNWLIKRFIIRSIFSWIHIGETRNRWPKKNPWVDVSAARKIPNKVCFVSKGWNEMNIIDLIAGNRLLFWPWSAQSAPNMAIIIQKVQSHQGGRN